MKTTFKLIFLFTIISFFINHESKAQTWQELFDSTGYYFQISDFQNASGYGEKALIKAEEEFGKSDTNYIYTAELLYNIYFYTQNFDRAIELSEQVVSLYKENVCGDCDKYFYYVNDLATLMYSSAGFSDGRMQTALKIQKENLENINITSGKENLNYIGGLKNLASIYAELRMPEEAGNSLNELEVLVGDFYGKDSKEYGDMMAEMGVTYYELNMIRKAENSFRTYLDINKEKNDDPDLVYGFVLTKYSMVLNARGKYLEAERNRIRGIQILESFLGKEHPAVIVEYSNLGTLYYNTGKLDQSQDLLLSLQKSAANVFGEKNSDYTKIIQSLADVYIEKGNYGEAEILLEKIQEINSEILKGNDPYNAEIFNSFGNLYWQMGRFDDADAEFRKSMNIYRWNNDTLSMGFAIILNNIAVINDETEDHNEAFYYFGKSRSIIEENFGKEHDMLQSTLSNEGVLYEKIGDYENSRNKYLEAVGISKKIHGAGNIRTAHDMINLAGICHKMNDDEEAKDLYREAYQIISGKAGKYSRLHIKTLQRLAYFYDDINEPDTSEIYWKETFDLVRDQINNYFPYLSDKEKTRFFDYHIKDHYERFLTYSTANINERPYLSSVIYNNRLLTKSLLLNSIRKTTERILNSNDSALIRKFHSWKAHRDVISTYSTLSDTELRERAINLDSLKSEVNDLEKELSIASTAFRKEFSKENVSWKDIREILNKDEAAVEIIRFRKFGFTDNKYNPEVKTPDFTDTVHYAALIITKETEDNPKLVIIKNGNQLENEMIKKYRKYIKLSASKSFEIYDVNELLGEIYDNYWAPLQNELNGKKKIYLSLDGVYNKLNLNTLLIPSSGKYLIEELDIRYVTNTKNIREKSVQQDLFNDDLNYAVLIGDPDFRLSGNEYSDIAGDFRKAEFSGLSLSREGLPEDIRLGIKALPGTRKEVDLISNSLGKHKWKIEKYTGKEAIEEVIKAVDNPGILHIATHGKFLADIETFEGRSFGFQREIFVRNPLLRSFLLFAGSEETINKPEQFFRGREDGILTAYEAMNLNLDKTALVVLSACETGQGEVKNGEGVIGLQRAFRVAGAKNIIMSLWSVSDEATHELMSKMYDYWLNGDEIHTAFRKAQLDLKKEYPGFYYWGAFVMVGS